MYYIKLFKKVIFLGKSTIRLLMKGFKNLVIYTYLLGKRKETLLSYYNTGTVLLLGPLGK